MASAFKFLVSAPQIASSLSNLRRHGIPRRPARVDTGMVPAYWPEAPVMAAKRPLQVLKSERNVIVCSGSTLRGSSSDGVVNCPTFTEGLRGEKEASVSADPNVFESSLETRISVSKPDVTGLHTCHQCPSVENARDFLVTYVQRNGFSLINVTTFMKLAAVSSLLFTGLCSPAWGAAAEIAKANVDSGFFGDLDDVRNGFASAFLLIFFSEIGDKTFFIAALLAMRKPTAAVFSGTFGALMVMTVISVILGRTFHYIDELLPSIGDKRVPWDDVAAVFLLVYFGVSTLIEAAQMEDSKQDEEQQEAELAIAGIGGNGAIAGTVAATFALVFVAEWGDKSFFSTIALAAASSPLGVISGAIAGHGAATLLAVVGGSVLANYVSEKVIAYVGGVLFLVFAGVTLAEIVN